MSCTGCTRKFGFFEKELGCPDCGFSYCKKCLKHEAKDPNKEDATRYICAKCFVKQVHMEPPLHAVDEFAEKFRRCIETMSESDKNIKIDFKDPKQKFGNLKEGFDHETQKLQARLQTLEEDYKKTRPKLKTEAELSEWLDKIQNKPSTSQRPNNAYQPPDTRSETECSDQLMRQFVEETAIDAQVPKPELELEERLARLRGKKVTEDATKGKHSQEMESPGSSKKPTKGIWGLDLPNSDQSEEEDESAAEAIVKKALLDAEMEKLNVNENEDLAGDEGEDLEAKKFPWCVICNENATVKCLECDGDLYCDDCFTECCKPEEHLSEPFEISEESQET